MADFNKAINIEPEFAEAYYNRGNAWMQKDSLWLAVRDYNCAIELDTTLCPAMNNRGQVYTLLGKYDKALESFDLALARNRWVNDVKSVFFFWPWKCLFSKQKIQGSP